MSPLKAFLKELESKVVYVQRGGDPRLLEGCLNIVLTGNPGAGKTTAARLLFRSLRSYGMLQNWPLLRVVGRCPNVQSRSCHPPIALIPPAHPAMQVHPSGSRLDCRLLPYPPSPYLASFALLRLSTGFRPIAEERFRGEELA